MEFDEYDYLEKTVENPELQKSKETLNGAGATVISKNKQQPKRSKHNDDDDFDHSSKCLKSGDSSQDRERERGSSHRRLSSTDGERSERDKCRSSREQREGEKANNREGRDRKSARDRENDRDHDRRDHDRELERDQRREKECDRSRQSGSRPERHRDGNDREKSRDKEYREREKDKDLRERDRESRRHKEKKEGVVEPEADPERDQRTVFAYQISLKADERDVYEFFARAGKIRDVRLIMDRNSRRSKGIGYIEFYDAMSVPMAIALSGQSLLGSAVMVKPSEAEKNLVQTTASVAGGAAGNIGPYSGGAKRLHVGNLHSLITDDQLRQVFEAFGTVELVQLPTDPGTGQCKGYGFVQFSRLEDARAAQSLDGQLEIGGRVIKVSYISDQAGMQDVGANAGDFDDDEGGVLALNARSRALLMQKLDRTGTGTSIASSISTPVASSPGLAWQTSAILGATSAVSAPVAPILQAPALALAGFSTAGLSFPAVTLPSGNTVGLPSDCLLMKNMFDPKLEFEPDFDLDIKEDVEGECSKFGMLRHIYVDKNSDGFVYLRFVDTQSAVNAQRALHGRWFAGKMITATFMLPQSYETKFPDCR